MCDTSTKSCSLTFVAEVTPKTIKQSHVWSFKSCWFDARALVMLGAIMITITVPLWRKYACYSLMSSIIETVPVHTWKILHLSAPHIRRTYRRGLNKHVVVAHYLFSMAAVSIGWCKSVLAVLLHHSSMDTLKAAEVVKSAKRSGKKSPNFKPECRAKYQVKLEPSERSWNH